MNVNQGDSKTRVVKVDHKDPRTLKSSEMVNTEKANEIKKQKHHSICGEAGVSGAQALQISTPSLQAAICNLTRLGRVCAADIVIQPALVKHLGC